MTKTERKCGRCDGVAASPVIRGAIWMDFCRKCYAGHYKECEAIFFENREKEIAAKQKQV